MSERLVTDWAPIERRLAAYYGVDLASRPDRTAMAAYKKGQLAAMYWIDEAGSITPRQVRVLLRHKRKQRAKDTGWANWYINRGRLPLNPSRKDLRQLSHRRAH